MAKYLTSAAAALLAFFPGSGPAQAPAPAPAPTAAPELRIISDFDSPPFSYVENGASTGFEYDLGEAIGRELGMPVKWIKRSFNLPSFGSTLDTGGADAAMASITVTPDREKSYIFSRPYFRTSLAAATKRDVDWNSLNWKNGLSAVIRVGVQRRTTSEEWVRKNLKATRKTYDSPQRLERALNSNDVEVIVMDEEILSYELLRRQYKFKIQEKGFDVQDYGIMLARTNSALQQQIDGALIRLDESGEYDRLYEKWFGHLADLPARIRPTRGDQAAE